MFTKHIYYFLFLCEYNFLEFCGHGDGHPGVVDGNEDDGDVLL